MEEYHFNNKINSNKYPEDRSSGLLLNINKGEFILFGGGNREKTFNDFWHLKIHKNSFEWQEIICSSEISCRFGIAGVVIVNGENNNKDKDINIFVHGGQNYFENKHYADMILLNLNYNFEDFSLKQISFVKNFTTYPLNIISCPRERNSHAMVSSQNMLYVFGGGSSDGLLNDLWEFDPIKTIWTKCKLIGVDISPREMHGMCKYTNKNKENFLYIIGGRLYENVDNKIYKINLTENNEKEYVCELVETLPISLCSFSYMNYKHFIIIYGGTDGINFLNEIMIYNIINHKFAKSLLVVNTELNDNNLNLSPYLGRIGSMMSICADADSDNELLVIFGGSFVHKDTNSSFVVTIKELLDENNLIPFI